MYAHLFPNVQFGQYLQFSLDLSGWVDTVLSVNGLLSATRKKRRQMTPYAPAKYMHVKYHFHAYVWSPSLAALTCWISTAWDSANEICCIL